MPLLGQKLRTGGPHLGLSIMYPSAGIVERIGADWDWIWIDTQHGHFDYRDLLELVRACDLVQRPAIVRVPSHESGAIGVALDTGAAGVIIPLVNTPEEAQACVKAAKFPPLGERSFGGRRLIDRHGRGYAQDANLDTLLIVQIETPGALERIDEIAAVTGVDGIFYGGDDVMLRLGHDMTKSRSFAEAAPEIRAVASACRKHDKFAVNVSFSPELQALSRDQHYGLIVCGADSAFLASGSRQASASAREIVTQARSSIAASINMY